MMLEADAHDPDGKYLLALIELEKGAVEEGVQILDEILESHPDHVDALNTLALIYIRHDRHVEAEPVLGRAMGLAPDRAETILNMAVVCQALGRPSESVGLVQRALKIQNGIPAAYFLLGNCYQELNDLPNAAKAFRETVRLDPKFVEAKYNLWLAEGMESDTDGTIEALLKARERRPDDRSLSRHLGRIYMAEGNLKKGMVELQAGSGFVEISSAGDTAFKVVQ